MAGNSAIINAENQGPLLNIISWILMVIMCLAVFTKGLSKWMVKRTLELDDIYMLGSMALAIGITICISLQVASGLGRHMSRLDTSNIFQYQKAEYSWQILYLWSLFFAKAALLQMLSTLCRTAHRRHIVRGVSISNVLVTIIFTFTAAFQCPIPNTWAVLSPQCENQTAMWNAFGVLDIIIDLATVILPFYLLHDLQLRLRPKLQAIIAFASRALIIPFIIVRLVFLNRAQPSLDQSFDQWITVLLTDVHANVNIIFTCIPFLKPIILGMQSGVLTGDFKITPSINTARYYRTESLQKDKNDKSSSNQYGIAEHDSDRMDSMSDCDQVGMTIRHTREVNVEYIHIDDGLGRPGASGIASFR